MKTITILLSVVFLTVSLAQAQRGRGMGAAGGRAASPQLSTPTRGNDSSSMPGSSTRAATPRTSMPHDATVASRVESNPNLASRVQPLLPAGTTIQSAAAGFKNEGQFLAALHVSHNLNIPFSDIRSQMTGSNPVSLGKAIQTLRPQLDKASVKKEVKAAEKQAKTDSGS